MSTSRRWFLKRSGALGVALTGLKPALAAAAPRRRENLGALVPDRAGRIDLPEGFEYKLFSTVGEEMHDGFRVPAGHDGMACFPGQAAGEVILIRNHELLIGDDGPFGPGNQLADLLDPALLYDRGTAGPIQGGTTNLVYDTTSGELKQHYLSLAGTARNCCGGPTPWDSWITCEEATYTAGDQFAADHGYNFEVPADAGQPVEPVALKAMGRFNHEAVAVDPASGIVYQTEDRDDGLFYRFIPDQPGKLARGGRLQCLGIRNATGLDTRNWNEFTRVPSDRPLETWWIDVDDVESPADDIRYHGRARGAAIFARGEGMWYADGSIYFACTSGGEKRGGQVWRYDPSPEEGQKGERRERAKLSLLLESPHRRLIDMCDNLTVAPWGDLILCEDGGGENYLVGVTENGDIYPVARNAASGSEFAGACFSPDGRTLFCNVQGNGWTLAITGPWPS